MRRSSLQFTIERQQFFSLEGELRVSARIFFSSPATTLWKFDLNHPPIMRLPKACQGGTFKVILKSLSVKNRILGSYSRSSLTANASPPSMESFPPRRGSSSFLFCAQGFDFFFEMFFLRLCGFSFDSQLVQFTGQARDFSG
jgi:hypothetical protein